MLTILFWCGVGYFISHFNLDKKIKTFVLDVKKYLN